jgi:hypothetical protein
MEALLIYISYHHSIGMVSSKEELPGQMVPLALHSALSHLTIRSSTNSRQLIKRERTGITRIIVGIPFACSILHC